MQKHSIFNKKGDEYSYMLKNIDIYCKKFGLKKLGRKTHPEDIYTDPQSRPAQRS